MEAKDIIQDDLLKFLNKKGFALELRTKSVLDTLNPQRISLVEKQCPFVLSSPGHIIEFDGYLLTCHLEIFIECKKTSSTLFFTKDTSRDHYLHFLFDSNGYKLRSTIVNDKTFPIAVSSYDIGIPTDNGKLIFKKEDEKHEPVHKAIYQLTNYFEWYIQNRNEKRVQHVGATLIMVTNADLFMIDFDGANIDQKGDLKKITRLEKIPYLAHNFSKVFHWDKNGCQKVNHITPGEEASQVTIFVVNIASLQVFLEKIEEWADIHDGLWNVQ